MMYQSKYMATEKSIHYRKNIFNVFTMSEKVILSGPKIRQARGQVSPKMTQEDAAKKLGITRVTYIGWEKALKVRVTLHEANKMAKAFSVKVEDLTYKEEMENVNTVHDPGINYQRESEQLAQLYKEIVASKDKHIQDNAEQIKQLIAEKDKIWAEKDKLWNLINTLTEGFASLKKT
jgi:DNA-binding XRE family transcriptional regulator